MKRLLLIVFIISIGVYLTVQYYKDRRFNPPSAYDYEISDEIDRNYHDPSLLENYYETALEVGTYARSLWFNESIDVRNLDKENYRSIEAIQHYNQLIVAAKRLEDQLVYSKSLKDQGYSDAETQLMIQEGLNPTDIKLNRMSHLLNLQIGLAGSEVWDLQLLLNEKGDSIPVDGIFSSITRQRVIEIQRSNNIYPSGTIDEKTLRILLKD